MAERINHEAGPAGDNMQSHLTPHKNAQFIFNRELLRHQLMIMIIIIIIIMMIMIMITITIMIMIMIMIKIIRMIY